MCGIAGVIDRRTAKDATLARLQVMLDSIRHRGPDDHGTWASPADGVALGHRRLSILELSAAGHQPMVSACGRFVIVFNGEIYNHLELRKSLRTDWRGHSDTETLLACISQRGVEQALQQAVGMFAFALWDADEKTLTLARDRLGEKPLYYGWQGDVFLFASEIKALRSHPAFRREIDWDAACEFLRRNYVPAPSSIFKGIHKLPPGTYLTLAGSDVHARVLPEVRPYWSLGDAALSGIENPFRGTFDEAVDELEALVGTAVRLQAVADVPVGAFLSGGIDSSTVVALMKKQAAADVTTFSIGMSEKSMDESAHAASVARYLGTRHVAHTIEPAEALALIPRLAEIWDEPFADSSQIPTLLVSQLARREVTVALSGDGGDEFFLGYTHYPVLERLWRYRPLGKLPWRAGLSLVGPVTRRGALGALRRRAESIVTAWEQPDGLALNDYWKDRYRKRAVPLRHQGWAKSTELPALTDIPSSAALSDAGSYLPDDILVKVDRAAMAVSLETRAPLLDHRIVEFAYRLPTSYKLHNGQSKRVLREVLYRHVPRELVDRPKMGFSIPLANWLRTALRPWAEELLMSVPPDSPVFEKSQIALLWKEHLRGRDRTEQLWGILALVGFLRTN